MGQHSSAESLMAGVESDGIRMKAAALAVQMHHWLAVPVTSDDDIFKPDAYGFAKSDLVEWCRSARDILEAVGRG